MYDVDNNLQELRSTRQVTERNGDQGDQVSYRTVEPRSKE
jgi:hypothetical protein